jgi:hypothetical protein
LPKDRVRNGDQSDLEGSDPVVIWRDPKKADVTKEHGEGEPRNRMQVERGKSMRKNPLTNEEKSKFQINWRC